MIKLKKLIEENKYYHTTSEKLPKNFIVKKRLSDLTNKTMADEYGIKDFSGGLFVSEISKYSKLYGKYIYEISSDTEPVMLDWGKYIFPVGTKVKAILVKQ